MLSLRVQWRVGARGCLPGWHGRRRPAGSEPCVRFPLLFPLSLFPLSLFPLSLFPLSLFPLSLFPLSLFPILLAWSTAPSGI